MGALDATSTSKTAKSAVNTAKRRECPEAGLFLGRYPVRFCPELAQRWPHPSWVVKTWLVVTSFSPPVGHRWTACGAPGTVQHQSPKLIPQSESRTLHGSVLTMPVTAGQLAGTLTSPHPFSCVTACALKETACVLSCRLDKSPETALEGAQVALSGRGLDQLIRSANATIIPSGPRT
jgi:hypothetical protein